MSHVSGRRAGRRARGLGVRLVAVLLATAAWPVAAQAPGAPVAASQGRIRSLSVRGNERLEVETVLSYTDLAPGQAYDRERLDRALKDLFASELFADVRIRDDGQGNLVIEIRENPVVNRVLVEGAKRVKEDKIREEIRIAPRQIYTRSRVRSDVARILELYRRSGRFAARVEPKIVQLEQNRVDVVFEISEGPKSKIRQINIVGNERFSDRKLRGEMATRQARPLRIFTSRDTYDPDRLAFDQQKLRQFYLTQGYADFRVVSAIAELTPDRRDFIVTYVVEEGERYRFGEVDLVSQLRDVKAEDFKRLLPMKPGDWYNAKQIEDTINSLTNAIGLLGYAFADIRPQFRRDRDKREMNVTFLVNETPRVYVELVNIRGNTITRDEVVRREFRLAEGDAFNSVRVRRSRDRIQSLGFFQEKLEIEQKPGAAPDQVTLEVNLEERPTGSIQVSAGYSTLEGLILNFAIQQRNFRGRAQNLRFGVKLVQVVPRDRHRLHRTLCRRPQRRPGRGRLPAGFPVVSLRGRRRAVRHLPADDDRLPGAHRLSRDRILVGLRALRLHLRRRDDRREPLLHRRAVRSHQGWPLHLRRAGPLSHVAPRLYPVVFDPRQRPQSVPWPAPGHFAGSGRPGRHRALPAHPGELRPLLERLAGVHPERRGRGRKHLQPR